MSGIVGSKLNIRGSGTVAKLGTDGQYLLSSGAGKSANYETVASAAYDDDKVQSNIALLGFKTAVNGSLAKYNLQDQIIDEYEDATGIDASASTNERLTSGVYDGVSTATVTGGSTAVDGDYTVHTITAAGSTNFITDTAITVDYLLVGGGGAGGMGNGGGGGGGAGGLIYQTSQSLAIGTFVAVVGTGGTGAAAGVAAAGGHGTDTTFNSETAGGGAGGPYHAAGVAGDTANGGSGSGTSGDTSSGGAAGSQGTTNAGGQGAANDGGGGGGAGGAGGAASSTVGGPGGVGLSNSITGSAVYYAGGGAGDTEGGSSSAAGGNGGGGNGHASGGGGIAATDGTDGKGGGGGGSDPAAPTTYAAGDGGNGVVIIRRLTSIVSSGGDLTLQSTANTASSAATKADLIMLMENSSGTATINTDIKGYVTADGGSNWTEGTLVDEGSWGTNKKILAFHDATVTSGTDMRYKITTHNQSAGSKETKIHATSIGWKA